MVKDTSKKLKIEMNNIYNLDCLIGLRAMEDNSVDITITSPPYNVGKKIQGKGKYVSFEDNMPMDKYFEFIKEVVSELIRVTKYYVFFNFQILTNNNLAYYQLFNEFKYNIKDTIIWHKSTASPTANDYELTSAFEFVLVFTKEEYAKQRKFEYTNKYHFIENKYNRNIIYDSKYIFETKKMIKENNKVKKNNFITIDPSVLFDENTNVIYGSGANAEKFVGRDKHRAIFPEYFVEWFIARFTNQDDIVLDPFLGGGTTAYVSRKLGRNYIGFETEKKYIDISKNRLREFPSLENSKIIREL